MPILKSSKKKMRRDKTATARNAEKKTVIKSLVKTMRRTPNADNWSKAASALDKAVKTNFIHANKAARLKSRLSHLIPASK
jgi:small subunit ribosomal protein S20